MLWLDLTWNSASSGSTKVAIRSMKSALAVRTTSLIRVLTSVEKMIGKELADQVRNISLRLYRETAAHAHVHNIIIANTKFEFGLDNEGRLYLIDEVLTPDSSRFWPADQYQIGISPPSFDKQFVRDYLETLSDWNKQAPGPKLPADILVSTTAKYREALTRLTGQS